jgi:hypothetical protein
MTPERLNFLIETTFRRRRGDREAHYAGLARFFEVDVQTLRRWRTGDRPIPRAVEIVMEIFHHHPQITADSVNNMIAARDDEASKA